MSAEYVSMNVEKWVNLEDRVYDQYLHHLQTLDYKRNTINHKELLVRTLLTTFISMGLNDFSEVDQNAVNKANSDFIHFQPSVIKSRVQDMRQFFEYCYANSLTQDNKCVLIPNINTPHQERFHTYRRMN